MSSPSDLVLSAEGLQQSFAVARSVAGRTKGWLRVLRGVSLELARGEIFGLAGESGSGKSTLGRILAGIDRPLGGRLLLGGRDVFGDRLENSLLFKRTVQMVFQDPSSSLNPRRTTGQTLEVPLQVLRLARGQRSARVAELLDLVELDPRYALQYPSTLSGGQKQRVALARALALNPQVLILDEPTSALDVSVQAKIIKMLLRLRSQLGLSYVLISHDLSLMRNVADRTSVMYLGRIVEAGPTPRIFQGPQHPYTQMLLAAVPTLTPDEEALKPAKVQPVGEIPSPSRIPSGCSFHPRCPFAMPVCSDQAPPAVPKGEGQFAECHLGVPAGRA